MKNSKVKQWFCIGCDDGPCLRKAEHQPCDIQCPYAETNSHECSWQEVPKGKTAQQAVNNAFHKKFDERINIPEESIKFIRDDECLRCGGTVVSGDEAHQGYDGYPYCEDCGEV